jgi:trehalose 6-phosphate synthase
MTDDPRQPVLVASNRGPVSFGFAGDGSLTARRGGGGMVSGLMSGLASVAADGGVLWLCTALSDADREAARKGDRAAGGPADTPVRMLDVPRDVFEGAYNGIANSVLWFVHHLLFETPNQTPTSPITAPSPTRSRKSACRGPGC